MFLTIKLCTYANYRLIGLVRRVFVNGLGNLGSILGRIMPKFFLNGAWYLLA